MAAAKVAKDLRNVTICNDDKLEPLTWRIDDPIITRHNLPQVPYYFIKDIRQRNEAMHVRDEQFHNSVQAVSLPPER